MRAPCRAIGDIIGFRQQGIDLLPQCREFGYQDVPYDFAGQ